MSTAFLVVRRAVKGDGTGCDNQFGPDTGSRVPLRMFASRDAAERLVAALAADARRMTNPFFMNAWGVTDEIRKQLESLQLPLTFPPKADDWESWWDQCTGLLTDEQCATVWAQFGPLLPFEVVEIELE